MIIVNAYQRLAREVLCEVGTREVVHGLGVVRLVLWNGH